MNKIVRHDYPASRLPPDLQQGLANDEAVTITIERQEKPPRRVMSLEEILAARRPPYRTADEIDADIRAGRDEWDE